MDINPSHQSGVSQSGASVGIKRPLYPSEPRPVTSPLQIALSEKHLLPALAALEAYFLTVRLSLDPTLEAIQPTKLGKPYPIGQCLEIAKAVETAVLASKQPIFTGLAAEGRAAFANYMAEGGVFRRVWGDLRGKFFQNAFQLGTLYVDVSNDTVTPTKPKIEILPFEEAGLNAIRDFTHFREIVIAYWGGMLFPNHVLPDLAPYCPLLHINAFGVAALREPTDYMIAMARGDQFASSQAILAEASMPGALFQKVRDELLSQGFKPAESPEEGRAQGIARCEAYRAKRWYSNEKQTGRVLSQVMAIKPFMAVPKKHKQDSHKAAEIRAHLEAAEREIADLTNRLAIAKTARAVYASALKEALPKNAAVSQTEMA